MKRTKKFLSLLLAVLSLLTGCASGSETPQGQLDPGETDGAVHLTLWDGAELGEPVKLLYTQRYEATNQYETEDAQTIAALVEALKNITVERETDLVFTDSDDVLTFVLADGSESIRDFICNFNASAIDFCHRSVIRLYALFVYAVIFDFQVIR